MICSVEEIRDILAATRKEITSSPWYPVMKRALIDAKDSYAAKVVVDTVKTGVVGAGKLMYGLAKGLVGAAATAVVRMTPVSMVSSVPRGLS